MTPALTDEGRVVRWSLSDAQWTALTTAPDAYLLSIAVTDALRASTYTAGAPVMPADTTQRSGVYTTTAVPFELRESFAELQTRLSGTTTQYVAYSLTTLSGTPSSASARGGITTNATPDSGASLLMIASFQAQSFTDPLTLKNYVRARWYDPQTGTFLSPDPMGYRDSSNLYAFAGGDPVNGRDPTGEAALDWETRMVLNKVQMAADVAARKHGMESFEDVVRRGDKDLGTKVHDTLRQLLAPGGRFHHDRILTEVEVSPAGTIMEFGERRVAAKNSLVKDVVILPSGMTSADVTVFRTKAREVTQLVVDLKTGLTGAPMHEAKTLVRFGVNNIELRGHGNVIAAYETSIRKLEKLKKRVARMKKYGKVPGAKLLFGGVIGGFSAAQALALAESGELDRALLVMSGLDAGSAAAEFLGNEAEERAQRFLGDRKLTREDRMRILEAVDRGEDPQQ